MIVISIVGTPHSNTKLLVDDGKSAGMSELVVDTVALIKAGQGNCHTLVEQVWQAIQPEECEGALSAFCRGPNEPHCGVRHICSILGLVKDQKENEGNITWNSKNSAGQKLDMAGHPKAEDVAQRIPRLINMH